MNYNETFTDLVESICRRRSMYVCGGSFYEVCAYVSGYAHASSDCPLSGDGWRAFNEFVCAAFRFPNNYMWSYVIKTSCPDEEQASERLRKLLTEFAERTKTQSHAEIVADMISRTQDREEGEPEKTWREFFRAVLGGNRTEIEPLIQEHPDAAVLWAGAYPDDAAYMLNQIAKSYPVTRISGLDADGSVTVITPDFGPVNVKLIGDRWRVDATKVIESWKANRANAQQG
jgi:hypothetical protein